MGLPLTTAGKACKTALKHPSRANIPTPTCDRLDEPFTLRACRNSLSEGILIPMEAAMSSLPLKVFVVALVAAFALATSANAENSEKVRKHKKVATSKTIQADPYHRGTNLVPAGPLYFGGVYLGDDPDPNIRFQLMRDISGRFGGDL
jgi:hypothetical protein